ncbi:MAG: translocation/assembly module TamB domain-containing protein, partial [Proteobacteria bacterium]|nr:translocation/assembly module TamB domain-containing protein [Pseudomonadota bacterium]
IQIKSLSAKDNRILTYQNSTLTSPGGLDIDLGSDFVRITPGLKLNLNDMTDLQANVRMHMAKPAEYAEFFGISDLEAGALDLQLTYTPCGSESCGGFNLKTGALSYMGIDIPNVDIDLDLDKSKLTTTAFKIDTMFARLNADIRADVSPKTIADPLNMPFNAVIKLTDIDLDSVNLEAIQGLGLHGKAEGTLAVDGPIENLQGDLFFTMRDIEVMDIPASYLSLRASYGDHKLHVPALNLWFEPSELSPEEAAKQDAEREAQAKAAEQSSSDATTVTRSSGTQWLVDETASVGSQPRRRFRSSGPRVRRRTPDLSLGALTYDLEKQTVIFNVNLQPISPNEFQIFRDLELPIEGQVSLDLSANIDLSVFDNPNRKIEDTSKATWVEGEINLLNAKYGDIHLGNTQILMSRSAQYALIKGNIIDIFDLTGFVRTAPRFSASIALNFPDLDVLQTLEQLNIDVSNLTSTFGIHNAGISGSIGFCMKSFDDMQVSVMFDDLHASVLGNKLELTQPAYIRADLNTKSVTLNQLELKYRDSVLKLSGNANADGDISFDLNGEIDAAIARSFVDSVNNASGLLGVSVSARGNMFHHDTFSLKNLELTGYLGVRDPIQILTGLSQSPIELKQGFVLIDRSSSRCKSHELCLYTPEDLPFMLGINDQWLNLALFANASGYVDVNLGGTINAGLAQLFVKDISTAKGAVDLQVDVDGQLLDKNGALTLDLNNFNYSAQLSVAEPVSVELNALNDPITLDDGILQITQGNTCTDGGQCIIIPKERGFQGSLMGGKYLIFGEIQREAITPKSGNLSITANNVSFRMRDELALTVSPDIQITAKDLADFNTVKVSGDIDIAEAKYKKDFDDGSSNFIRDQIMSIFIDSRKRVDTYSPSFLRKNPELGKINLDVGVNAENSINVDVKIATAVVDLELGSQLRIGGTIKEFAPTGIFSINQGLFSLRNNDFEFQNGAQIAFNGSLDGKIDITATTEINTSSDAFSSVTGNTDLDRRKRVSTGSAGSSSDLYAITLTVGGTVFRPVWSFESSPYLTDTNVYALILTGKTIEDFSGNDIAMESLLSPFFSSQLDTFINADQFKFVFSKGAAQFIYVNQINKALRIAAAVSIRGAEGNEQALSGEYYFNDNWFVDLTGQNTSDEEGKAPTFKLGARLHWHLPIE